MIIGLADIAVNSDMSISQKIGLRKVYQGWNMNFFRKFLCFIFISSSSITKLHTAILSNCSFHLLTQWRICLIAYTKSSIQLKMSEVRRERNFIIIWFVRCCLLDFVLMGIKKYCSFLHRNHTGVQALKSGKKCNLGERQMPPPLL